MDQGVRVAESYFPRPVTVDGAGRAPTPLSPRQVVRPRADQPLLTSARWAIIRDADLCLGGRCSEMSTFYYARTTRDAERRPALKLTADGDADTPEQQVSALAQRLAALVPAEVLVAYGIGLALAVTK